MLAKSTAGYIRTPARREGCPLAKGSLPFLLSCIDLLANAVMDRWVPMRGEVHLQLRHVLSLVSSPIWNIQLPLKFLRCALQEMMMFQRLLATGKMVFEIFRRSRGASRGAAIAFYTVTAIVPILLIVIAIAGLVLGQEAASGALYDQFRSLLGSSAADVMQKAIASASDKSAGSVATVISILTLLVTASGVFLELEDALNSIWGIELHGGFLQMARARVASLGLVVALGFLLMVSLVVDAALKALNNIIDAYLPFGSVILVALSSIISFALISLLFAAILKFLPAKRPAWRDVIAGALLTGFLFEIGKFLIGLYLGSNAMLSSLGAAGAFLALLFWVYYTAQIFLLGAAFTKAFARPVHENPNRPHAIEDQLPTDVGSARSHRVLGLLAIRMIATKAMAYALHANLGLHLPKLAQRSPDAIHWIARRRRHPLDTTAR